MMLLLAAVLRALFAATAVWTSLRILGVKNLVAQKAAWAMVLAASLAMPFLLRRTWTPAWAELKLPASISTRALSRATPAAPVAVVHPMRSSGESQNIPPPVSISEDPFPSLPSAIAETHRGPSENPDGASVAVQAPALSATPTRTSSMGHRFLTVAWILYLAGCTVLLLRLLWGLATSLWLWFGAKRVRLPAHLDFPGSIPVGWNPRVRSPVNIGPWILLPADYVDWDDEKLRVVLAHERSHIRQRDFYLQLLAGLYTAFTWFSPLGWWLKYKLSELGEAISDRAGLEAAASPSAYAGLLLEFAALPRPRLNGVAMAHSSNLSHRIDRFLNDSSFHLAFTGGRRALLTLAVPALLIAASTMVRVQAAAAPQQASPSQTAALMQDQATSQTPITGQSNPQPVQVTDSGPAQEAAPASAPEAAPAPPMPSPAPGPGPAPEAAPVAPMPPAPQAGSQEPMPIGPGGNAVPVVPPVPPIHVEVNIPPMPPKPIMAFAGYGPCFSGGDSYAIVGDPGTKTRFCGDWGNEGASDVDKARAAAHGHFLLFRHEGKLYIDDDPATVSQIETMDKARQDVGDQMRALSKQMREAGEQARDAARKARESAASVPAPDLSKEIAALDATAASLKDKQGGTVSRQQLQELQREIGEIQRRVIEAEIGASMKDFNAEMGRFGQEQGKFGAQMGKFGAQMGQMSRENNQQIRSIIDDSLKDGKARPVN
jgi:beta-lactamase regulating signal transducer with metallopeptidase domain